VKILLAGLGSIGRRHARNLRALLGDELELLAYRVRGEGDLDAEYGLRSFADLDEALAQEPDAVFVTSPASEHVSVALAAARAGCHLFVEKPLSHSLDGVEELIGLVEEQGRVGMVGYQLRFHPSFRRFQEFVAAETVLAAEFEVGEYLPDMHPWEDYRRLNYSRRDQGGGVLLQFSHDFDLAHGLFGMPRRVFAVGGKRSDLEIDVEDTASTLLDYGGLAVHVLQDFVRRPPVRSYELIGGTRTETWDDSVDRNELFLAELRHFLACLEGREQPVVDLRAGADVLRIALAASRSLETGDAVAL
jgi:predicted dehydrogenase